MDGCTELVRRKWGREALKPGGSPGANLLVQGRPPDADVGPGRRLHSGQHWKQQHKQKPTYLVSEYLQVINQANEMLNKICSVLLP